MLTSAETIDHKPRRGKARLRTGMPASLTTMDGRQQVSLVDLSETGAGLVVREPHRVNGGVLKWMDYEVYGTVVRRGHRDVGLQFAEPIDLEWVLETRAWLPALADGKAELRRFARSFVSGEPARPEPARISAMGAPRYSGVVAARTGVSDWLHTGTPIVLCGAVIGAIAGYWSIAF